MDQSVSRFGLRNHVRGRLNDACLVVCRHHGRQRAAFTFAEQAAEFGQVENTLASDRTLNDPHACIRGFAQRGICQDRVMLNRGDNEPCDAVACVRGALNGTAQAK